MFDYSNNKILVNQEAFEEVFVPERLFHRDGQRNELVRCLQPSLSGGKPLNAFLYGATGTGKTVLTRHVLKELEEKTSKVRTVYVNCWQSTTHSLLSNILRELGEFLTGKEPGEELVARLRKYGTFILALDEVDQMSDLNLLYNFVRGGVALICISNDPNALLNIDFRIKSSLSLEPIEFPQYKTNEIYDIVKDRATFALAPNSISQDLLRKVAEYSLGDARVALNILRVAALNAEQKGKKIGLEDVKKGWAESKFLKREKRIEDLNEHQKILVEILRGKQLSSKELYSEYAKSVEKPISERMYRNYMEELVKKCIVKRRGTSRWRVFEIG